MSVEVGPAAVIHERVGIRHTVHDNGSRSSRGPASGPAKSPCKPPAVAKMPACHCSTVKVADAVSGSTVTWTSWSAAATPTGSTRRNVPSSPTRISRPIGYGSVSSKENPLRHCNPQWIGRGKNKGTEEPPDIFLGIWWWDLVTLFCSPFLTSVSAGFASAAGRRAIARSFRPSVPAPGGCGRQARDRSPRRNRRSRTAAEFFARPRSRLPESRLR